MVFGWNLGTFAEPLLLGTTNEQRTLALTLYQRGVVQSDYGLSSAMGVVLLVLAFVVSWVSLRYSRGALVLDHGPHPLHARPDPAGRHPRPRLHLARLIVFVTPFLVLVSYSFSTPGGTSAVDNFQYVMGSFLENLVWSFVISAATLIGNVLIALPAAYALIRYPVPAKKVLLTLITLPLYVPGAVDRPVAASSPTTSPTT